MKSAKEKLEKKRTRPKAKTKASLKARKDKKKAGRANPIEIALYVLLAIVFAAFVITEEAIFTFVFLAVFLVLIAEEIRINIKEEGIKKTVKEALEAIAIVLVLWIIAVLLLGNSSPIDVVPSCSMLPTLRIGDLVVLEHISNMSAFLQKYKIPVVKVTPQQYQSMLENMNSEFVAYYAYLGFNPSDITYLIKPGVPYNVALYNVTCLDMYSSEGKAADFYRCQVNESEQKNNLIKYHYSLGEALVNGSKYLTIYTSSITIGNTTITENYSNPIVVYRTTPLDTFSGDIVHRVVAAIQVGQTYYLLTKGDNNPILDIQAGNYPPSTSQVMGYVIAKVPWLGYITLALKGGIETQGCDQQLLH